MVLSVMGPLCCGAVWVQGCAKSCIAASAALLLGGTLLAGAALLLSAAVKVVLRCCCCIAVALHCRCWVLHCC